MIKFNETQHRLAALLDIALARGWDRSYVSVSTRLEPGTEFELDYAYIYLRRMNEGGELASGPDIYLNAYRFDEAVDSDFSPESFARKNIPNAKEHIARGLFAAIASVKQLSAELRLSADFLNPIEALADQLRTNILPNLAK